MLTYISSRVSNNTRILFLHIRLNNKKYAKKNRIDKIQNTKIGQCST